MSALSFSFSSFSFAYRRAVRPQAPTAMSSVSPQPRAAMSSVLCRASTASLCGQRSLPDLNCDLLRPVFPAGPQCPVFPAGPQCPVFPAGPPCPVFPAGPQPRTCQKECQKICQKKWQKICQQICRQECQKEG